jgi:hypothetical protein
MGYKAGSSFEDSVPPNCLEAFRNGDEGPLLMWISKSLQTLSARLMASADQLDAAKREFEIECGIRPGIQENDLL